MRVHTPQICRGPSKKGGVWKIPQDGIRGGGWKFGLTAKTSKTTKKVRLTSLQINTFRNPVTDISFYFNLNSLHRIKLQKSDL